MPPKIFEEDEDEQDEGDWNYVRSPKVSSRPPASAGKKDSARASSDASKTKQGSSASPKPSSPAPKTGKSVPIGKMGTEPQSSERAHPKFPAPAPKLKASEPASKAWPSPPPKDRKSPTKSSAPANGTVPVPQPKMAPVPQPKIAPVPQPKMAPVPQPKTAPVPPPRGTTPAPAPKQSAPATSPMQQSRPMTTRNQQDVDDDLWAPVIKPHSRQNTVVSAAAAGPTPGQTTITQARYHGNLYQTIASWQRLPQDDVAKALLAARADLYEALNTAGLPSSRLLDVLLNAVRTRSAPMRREVMDLLAQDIGVLSRTLVHSEKYASVVVAAWTAALLFTETDIKRKPPVELVTAMHERAPMVFESRDYKFAGARDAMQRFLAAWKLHSGAAISAAAGGNVAAGGGRGGTVIRPVWQGPRPPPPAQPAEDETEIDDAPTDVGGAIKECIELPTDAADLWDRFIWNPNLLPKLGTTKFRSAEEHVRAHRRMWTAMMCHGPAEALDVVRRSLIAARPPNVPWDKVELHVPVNGPRSYEKRQASAHVQKHFFYFMQVKMVNEWPSVTAYECLFRLPPKIRQPNWERTGHLKPDSMLLASAEEFRPNTPVFWLRVHPPPIERSRNDAAKPDFAERRNALARQRNAGLVLLSVVAGAGNVDFMEHTTTRGFMCVEVGENIEAPIVIPVYRSLGQLYDDCLRNGDAALALAHEVIHSREGPSVVPMVRESRERAEIMQKRKSKFLDDVSQLRAFTATFGTRVTIVQGPPGTGKSYLGAQVISALVGMRNSQTRFFKDNPNRFPELGPILVLSFKPHALDEVLRDARTQILEVMPTLERVPFLVYFGAKSRGENESDVLKGCIGQPDMNVDESVLKELLKARQEMQASAQAHMKELKIMRYQLIWTHLDQETKSDLMAVVRGTDIQSETVLAAWLEEKGLSREKLNAHVESEKKKAADRLLDAQRQRNREAQKQKEAKTTKAKSRHARKKAARKMKAMQEGGWGEVAAEIEAGGEEEEQEDGGQDGNAVDDDMPVVGPKGRVENLNHQARVLQQRRAKQQEDDADDDETFTVVHTKKQQQQIMRRQNVTVDEGFIAREERRRGIRTVENAAQMKLQTKPWSMNMAERHEKVERILRASAMSRESRWRECQKEYIKLCKARDDMVSNEVVDRIKWAHIVGATMSDAARYITAIRRARPCAIVVEEAGEALEQVLLSCLVPSVQMLIMIGDHQQLQPEVPVQAYTRHMELSLMERMTRMGFPVRRLEMQRRMRPEICDLVRPEYDTRVDPSFTGIKDHPCVMRKIVEQGMELVAPGVAASELVPGMGLNLYFWEHDHPESESLVGVSLMNEMELQMCAGLVKHLLRNGVQHEAITVLSPFIGQVREADKMLNVRRGYATGPQRRVKVFRVDQFQGDENNFIILMLVRTAHATDFIQRVNRMIVALSRARVGMVVMGSRRVLEHVPHWKRVLHHLEWNLPPLIGRNLPIKCKVHGIQVVSTEPADYGGPLHMLSGIAHAFKCKQRCLAKLKCGHECEATCHLDNPADHPSCSVDVHVPRRCGVPDHVDLVPCKEKRYRVAADCQVKIPHKRSECGHMAQVTCGTDVAAALAKRCEAPEKTNCPRCGKQKKTPCWTLRNDVALAELLAKCDGKVEHVYPCAHTATLRCVDSNTPPPCAEMVPFPCVRCGTTLHIRCASSDDADARAKVEATCNAPDQRERAVCKHTVQAKCCELDKAMQSQCEESVPFPCTSCGGTVFAPCHLLSSEGATTLAATMCELRRSVELPCGHHVDDVPCKNVATYSAPCDVKVQVTCVRCGEGQVALRCRERDDADAVARASKKCQAKVSLTLPCGHTVDGVVCTNRDSVKCKTRVTIPCSNCGGESSVTCHGSSDATAAAVAKNCTAKVLVPHPKCGIHEVSVPCNARSQAGDKKCKYPVEVKRLECGHTVTAPCSDQTNIGKAKPCGVPVDVPCARPQCKSAVQVQCARRDDAIVSLRTTCTALLEGTLPCGHTRALPCNEWDTPCGIELSAPCPKMCGGTLRYRCGDDEASIAALAAACEHPVSLTRDECQHNWIGRCCDVEAMKAQCPVEEAVACRLCGQLVMLRCDLALGQDSDRAAQKECDRETTHVCPNCSATVDVSCQALAVAATTDEENAIVAARCQREYDMPLSCGRHTKTVPCSSRHIQPMTICDQDIRVLCINCEVGPVYVQCADVDNKEARVKASERCREEITKRRDCGHELHGECMVVMKKLTKPCEGAVRIRCPRGHDATTAPCHTASDPKVIASAKAVCKALCDVDPGCGHFVKVECRRVDGGAKPKCETIVPVKCRNCGGSLPKIQCYQQYDAKELAEREAKCTNEKVVTFECGHSKRVECTQLQKVKTEGCTKQVPWTCERCNKSRYVQCSALTNEFELRKIELGCDGNYESTCDDCGSSRMVSCNKRAAGNVDCPKLVSVACIRCGTPDAVKVLCSQRTNVGALERAATACTKEITVVPKACSTGTHKITGECGKRDELLARQCVVTQSVTCRGCNVRVFQLKCDADMASDALDEVERYCPEITDITRPCGHTKRGPCKTRKTILQSKCEEILPLDDPRTICPSCGNTRNGIRCGHAKSDLLTMKCTAKVSVKYSCGIHSPPDLILCYKRAQLPPCDVCVVEEDASAEPTAPAPPAAAPDKQQKMKKKAKEDVAQKKKEKKPAPKATADVAQKKKEEKPVPKTIKAAPAPKQTARPIPSGHVRARTIDADECAELCALMASSGAQFKISTAWALSSSDIEGKYANTRTRMGDRAGNERLLFIFDGPGAEFGADKMRNGAIVAFPDNLLVRGPYGRAVYAYSNALRMPWRASAWVLVVRCELGFAVTQDVMWQPTLRDTMASNAQKDGGTYDTVSNHRIGLHAVLRNAQVLPCYYLHVTMSGMPPRFDTYPLPDPMQSTRLDSADNVITFVDLVDVDEEWVAVASMVRDRCKACSGTPPRRLPRRVLAIDRVECTSTKRTFAAARVEQQQLTYVRTGIADRCGCEINQSKFKTGQWHGDEQVRRVVDKDLQEVWMLLPVTAEAYEDWARGGIAKATEQSVAGEVVWGVYGAFCFHRIDPRIGIYLYANACDQRLSKPTEPGIVLVCRALLGECYKRHTVDYRVVRPPLLEAFRQPVVAEEIDQEFATQLRPEGLWYYDTWSFTDNSKKPRCGGIPLHAEAIVPDPARIFVQYVVRYIDDVPEEEVALEADESEEDESEFTDD